jgi:DNA-binding XRE family transcriptional regulator
MSFRHGISRGLIADQVVLFSCTDDGFSNALRMLESAQIRAALGWRQEDLSKASGVGTATIQRIEKSHHPITGYVSTLLRIQAAFEQAGIHFIADDEMGGFSVRMAKRTRKR